MIRGPLPLALAGLLSVACTASEPAGPAASEPVEQFAVEAEVAEETTASTPTTIPAPVEDHHPSCPDRFVYEGELTQGGFVRGVAPCGTQTVMLAEQEITPAADGSFFAAFDRDSPGELVLTAVPGSGDIQTVTLTIAPREWQIQRVNVARRPGGASESFMRRRQPELDAIWDARQRETGATGWQQNFIWPVTGRISGLFGRQRIYRGEPGGYHSGIDIAPGNGVPFVAPADGVVVLARTGFSLEGGLIIIDHGAGLNSAFLHASRIVVEEGQAVTQGQHIGNVGATGRATGPHLHWSLKWHLSRLDPLLFTGPMP